MMEKSVNKFLKPLAVAAALAATLTTAQAVDPFHDKGSGVDMLWYAAGAAAYAVKCGYQPTKADNDNFEWVVKMYGEGEIMKLALMIKDKADSIGKEKFCADMQTMFSKNQL
jgi:hypothetical protein